MANGLGKFIKTFSNFFLIFSVDCPALTSFELTIQICTPKIIQRQEVRSCAALNEVAVCRCGSATSSCPGISVCQNVLKYLKCV